MMQLQSLLSESTVTALAQVFLHFLWQGALMGLLAGCLLQFLPICTASTRYALFCGLLTLMALCPLITWLGISGGGASAIEVLPKSANDFASASAFANADAEESVTDSNKARSNLVPSSIQPADSLLRVAGAWLGRQRWLIVTAWLAGICCMATRLLLGAIGVWTLARRRQNVPQEVARVVARFSRQMAFRVRPSVYVVERISQAMAVGIFNSMVMLPASWISELPRDVLEAVIAHELAHLRRWDLVVNLLQRVVETVLFFHPAVWWCSRRLRIEREMCCDEMAQAALGNRVVYAKALAYLAHQQSSSLEFLFAAGIGDKKMVLMDRICNVLGMPRRRGRLYGPSSVLVGAVLAALVSMALFGLPGQTQSWTSIADEKGIVSESEHTRSSEAAKTALPTDSVKQSTPLDEVTQVLSPKARENLNFTERWDLSLEEAIKTAKANSKTMRSMGGHPIGSAGDSGSQSLSAQADGDLSQADFEQAVRNLVCDTQNAYWELWFAYRNLATSNTALDSARQTWRKIYRLSEAGTPDGEAKEEAQAREQYFQFKNQTQTLLNELFRAENRLRYVMGVSSGDGRLIRPSDEPTVAKVSFGWLEITQEAMSRNLDLRRQKSRVKQRELEYIAAKQPLQPRLESNGAHRPLDLPDGLQLRHCQLQLAKERAKLQDEELEVSRQLADAFRQMNLNYELTQTNFNRTLAADKQVEAVQAAFDAETVTIDQLLEAQRRRAEAQSSYSRAMLEYQRAIIAVHYRKGSLL